MENWPPIKGAVALKGQDEPQQVMDAEGQKRAYNRLRLFMNRSLQIDEEQFFHRQEMRCKKETADKTHTPIYWFYEKLSDYGSSVVRPVIGMGLLIVIGAVPMLFHLEMGQPATGAQFNTAVGWSISNTLPFLGFVLLFFWGLGLRNRFRLR